MLVHERPADFGDREEETTLNTLSTPARPGAAIREVPAEQLQDGTGRPSALATRLEAILLSAMRRVPGTPPLPGWAGTLVRHSTYPGFRLVVAQDEGTAPSPPGGLPVLGRATAAPESIVGFSYGYRGAVGLWWTDQVASFLESAGVTGWIGGHFELVELHVDPPHQGRGIGSALHDALLTGLSYDRVLLSTRRGPTVAVALYRSRGWRLLAGPVYFAGHADAYLIMGKRLR